MELKYHRELTIERWRGFPFFKQILMIATELNRAGKWIEAEDFHEVKRCYERALELWQKRHPDNGEPLPDIFTEISEVTQIPEDIIGRNRLVLKAKNAQELMCYTMDDE